MFFLYFFDGATDCTVTEQEIIYGRYLKFGKPHDVFLGVTPCPSATADGIYSSINTVLTESIGEEWQNKAIAAGCDGATVNLGCNNSVATRLKKEHPYFLVVHCVAHRLELAVLDVSKDKYHFLPDMLITV